MDIEPLTTQPQVSDFQPLEAYQSTTPTSFFAGTPVLHYTGPCTLSLTSTDLSIDPSLAALASTPGEANGTTPSTTINVEAFILSTTLTLWSSATSRGVRIPYRAISLHARQGAGVYLQLCLDDVRRVPDEELRSLEATLTPTSGEAEAEKLYTALSECADLWPDLPEEDGLGDGLGDDEGLGGGQWITAENMHEFVGDEGEEAEEDEVEELGPGAGSRRPAEEDEEDEAKWRRTE